MISIPNPQKDWQSLLPSQRGQLHFRKKLVNISFKSRGLSQKNMENVVKKYLIHFFMCRPCVKIDLTNLDNCEKYLVIILASL
jgi:hypothetical protein